ncbi:MAG: hypothetical protein M0R06_26175 [Sphaerochaeta sp.]|nr:hypothetical protein [Sphaerochaeta sp.]
MKQQNGLLGNPLGVLGPALFRKAKSGRTICVPRARYDQQSEAQIRRRKILTSYTQYLSGIYPFLKEFEHLTPPGQTLWSWHCQDAFRWGYWSTSEALFNLFPRVYWPLIYPIVFRGPVVGGKVRMIWYTYQWQPWIDESMMILVLCSRRMNKGSWQLYPEAIPWGSPEWWVDYSYFEGKSIYAFLVAIGFNWRTLAIQNVAVAAPYNW